MPLEAQFEDVAMALEIPLKCIYKIIFNKSVTGNISVYILQGADENPMQKIIRYNDRLTKHNHPETNKNSQS